MKHKTTLKVMNDKSMKRILVIIMQKNGVSSVEYNEERELKSRSDQNKLCKQFHGDIETEAEPSNRVNKK